MSDQNQSDNENESVKEQEENDLEYDEDGRPKGVAKLFNIIKEDLGEH